jgi:hypothetical protein
MPGSPWSSARLKWKHNQKTGRGLPRPFFYDRAGAMATINVLLVRTSHENGGLALVSPAHKAVSVEVDADNALERVCSYFAENWSAEVHALRWIFPADLLLPAGDRSPFLVLYVDRPGMLTLEHEHKDDASHSPASARSDIECVWRAATRSSKAEPWSNPLWLPAATDCGRYLKYACAPTERSLRSRRLIAVTS